jgi:hypothetical protein
MKTLMKALLVLGLAFGLTTATMVDQAEARRGRGAGIALGVGIGLLGAYALTRPSYGYGYSYSRACYPGPERCGHVGRRCWENRWGEVVCKGGEWRCYRPTICP